ncbi:LRR and NB-ARC domains-containing disease resistance protein, putative [Theobroma cacao]|uniref:LRR and NB-ARC domains-containing disease resistance protein, putative n=1 Tax=Theobroma cacao TaxID=3641 RepID=A0A061F966_THECC|nr:LRR and NB-ARC domains-containing disease resistance protein, putative [Theobroma cacao]
MELVGPIFEMAKCMGNIACIYIDHHRKLEERMNNLQSTLDILNIRKSDVDLRIKVELQWGKVVKEEVEKWLQDVEKINDEVQIVRQKIQVCPYFSRATLSKHVAQKIKEVEKINERGSYPEPLVIDRPLTSGVRLQIGHLEGEISIKEKIWGHLMGDVVGMIGICGMGGIGKTTIMKHINNQLLKVPRFDKVIWVTVSKELNIVKLQRDIASAMNEQLPEHELERVEALMEILEEKRYVLILDDVWVRFSLMEVGIPEPSFQNGSKLVLTSRSIEVCTSMGCEVVKVQPLSKVESRNLFLKNVGHGVLNVPTLEPILNCIIDECAGLPLAIVTIAGSMKGVYDAREWRNALEELRQRVRSVKGTNIEIFEQLKFSYDRLKDSKIQNCFLYCSLYPEDWEIPRNELIKYWIDEGLIHEFGSRQVMCDRGHAILNSLENNCLLERVVNGERVKMHDVLRDMALYIKSTVGSRFMVKAGMQLRELPSEQEWTDDLEKISLMHNFISEIPTSMSPKCPIVSTLFLQSNQSLKEIPGSFFEHMHGLNILDLSFTGIMDLPNSISNLKNLTALLLQGCENLRYLPSLAKLVALKKLDLRDTSIEEIPQGIDKLVNLTYLDLYSKSLEELPTGILPKLSRLQYLVADRESTTLKLKGEEAGGLKKLETICGRFQELQEFNTYMKSTQGKRLTSYVLAVGQPQGYFWLKSNFVKDVILSECEVGGEAPILLPNDLRCMKICECHNMKSLSDISFFQRNETELRECEVMDCKGIACVLDLLSSPLPCSPLQNLEKLLLSGLDKLFTLVKAQEVATASTLYAPTSPGIFSRLKSFHIHKCSKIKKLFSIDLLRDLQNLERIEVKSCGLLEEIIASEEEEKRSTDHATMTFCLPKLRELALQQLPRLKMICSKHGVMICDSLSRIEVIKCPKLKRIPLYIPLHDNGQPSPPPSLKEIRIYPKEWLESIEWDHPNAKNVLLALMKYREKHSWQAIRSDI